MGVFAYIHCKPDGTPFYVGKGALRRARYFGERNLHHKNIVAKYGKENLLYGVMECSDDATAYLLEMGLIKCLRRSSIELTNYTAGGDGGRSPTLETRAKLSAAAKKRGVSAACHEARVRAKKDVPLSFEHKETLRQRQTGKVFTEEHRRNISLSAKKRGMAAETLVAAHKANRGRVHSDEEKQKRGRSVSASLRSSGRTTKVSVDGVHHDTLGEAALTIGVTPSAVLYALRGSGVARGRRVERVV